MVSYWKTSDSVEAKLTLDPAGHYVMQMEGEKYPFPGFPRGTILYGKLSPIKHWIKNKIFNDCYEKIATGMPLNEIVAYVREEAIPFITDLGEQARYDMVPPEKMMPSVREVWRTLTAIENGSDTVRQLKEIFCFILQEDDAYRFRFQWIVKFFPTWWKPTLKQLEYSLQMLEYAETVGDMKERIALFRIVVLFLLKDPAIRARVEAMLKEMDWQKLKLSKADKYFFRAKYFKVDFPEYKY